MKRILIFVAGGGGGHYSLGEALRDQLAADYQITTVDPIPNTLIQQHYRTISRHALWLWEAEYKLSDGRRRARIAHVLLTLAFARRVARALRQTQPDLVLSTHPFFTKVVTFSMRRWKMDRPLVMIFSDPNAIHHTWLTERTAAITFAPTRETYRMALAAGFDPARLHFTGWPVRAQFYHVDPGSRAATLTGLRMDPDKFTVFVQGGGEGAAGFGRSVERLLEISGLQIILAAGTNAALIERFKDRSDIRPLAFTKQIAQYMAAADLVMGKAGPNVLFESIMLGKPFVATAYIPGQEEFNLEFIKRHGLGWVALDERSQKELLRGLVHDRARMEAMLETVDRYRRMNLEATQNIPELIKHLI